MTMPRRLRDDPSAARWLAERVREAGGPQSMPAAARKRVSDAIAGELTRGQRRPLLSAQLLSWPLLSWPLLSWPATGVLALAAFALAEHSVHQRHAEPPAVRSEDSGRAQLRREPPAIGATNAHVAARADLASQDVEPGEQVERAPDSNATVTPARAATRPKRVPAAKTHPHPSKTHGAARQPTQAPPWLAEARAALATDPERALTLIRAHREPHAPVSPDVVELTILALEAQRSAQSERARSQP